MFCIWFLSCLCLWSEFWYHNSRENTLKKELINPQYLLDIFYLLFCLYELRNGVFNIFAYIPFTSLKPILNVNKDIDMLSLWLSFGAANLHLMWSTLTSQANNCTTWWMTTLPSGNPWIISVRVCTCTLTVEASLFLANSRQGLP